MFGSHRSRQTHDRGGRAQYAYAGDRDSVSDQISRVESERSRCGGNEYSAPYVQCRVPGESGDPALDVHRTPGR